jgi:gamma-glutamyltranspeptidase / glutathione hydrolase
MARLLKFLGVFSFSSTLLLSACDGSAINSHDNQSKPLNSAVATVHPLATQAGEIALAQGGNAIDAAIAAALTLGIVDGHNSGIGGGCFILVRWANGDIEAIDGREMAPAKAHRNMYLRNGLADPSLSTTGALAIGVPGSLAAYDYLIAAGGKLTLPQLLIPAAELAEQGFPISQPYARRLAYTANKIRQFPNSAAILLDVAGQPHPAGYHFKQKDLANTYRNIAAQGIDYFYNGPFAEALERWMQNNGGLVSATDFANYQLKQRQPLVTAYRGHQIIGFPPPSSGGVHVAQILNMLEAFDVQALSEAERYHLLTETMKLAFADRAQWLGDPDFVSVPKGLIDPLYAKSLAQDINFDSPVVVTHAGTPPDATLDLFSKHTTHIAAADSAGNWVAITSTVNTSFGSKVIIPGTGVIMNNQMDDFSAQPGVQNVFGLVGAEANSIVAGKRPLSSMSPTIVLRNGQPIITLGAAGGPTIITQVVQSLVNVIDLDMSLHDALAAQRIHHQWQPNLLYVEPTMPQPVRDQLAVIGHRLVEHQHFGATQLIGLSDDQFIAVVEPRLGIKKPIKASAKPAVGAAINN